MFVHRCPWCGEKIPFFKSFVSVFHAYKEPNSCQFCKKPYKSVNRVIEFIFAIFSLYCFAQVLGSVVVFLSYHRLEKKLFIFLPLLLVLLVVAILCLRKPFMRYVEKDEETAEKKIATVFLIWESNKEGLRFPNLSVLNGEIFPACFLNSEGKPISTPICVVLENLKWEKGRRCRCTIQVVLDEVSEEGLFCPGNRLYLYHNRKKIAEGEII